MPELSRDAFHDVLRQLVSQRKYELWFASLRVGNIDPDGVVLTVGNPFHLEWIQTYYMDVVQRAVHESLGSRGPVRLIVEESEEEVEVDAMTVSPDPSPAVPAVTEQAVHNSDISLNDKYTFDNFVVGPSNQLAHAASRAVADSPAASYNPLFLHGDVGLGKTHLLQAICHQAIRSGQTPRVLYLSSETFVNQFIGAIEKGDIDRFRYKYRNVDMLLIDDIHLLANKERTQEEFFHTFNTLYNDRRQIVLSSDCPPSEIPTLRDRLISRFEWGLVAEIQTPRYETRLAILRRKARDRGIAIPEDVLAYLAENIDRNIRELEGAVTKVVGYAKLISRNIDVDLARQALGQSGRDAKRPITGVDKILDVVCRHYGVRITDLQGRKRTASIVLPRQVVMFLARRLTPLSLDEIGGHLGGRDHSTVLHSVGKIQNLVDQDPDFAQLVNDLESRSQR